MKWIFAIAFIAFAANLALATPTYEASMLVAKLPSNWKMVTQQQNQYSKITEYIPQNEQPGQHSKIIATVVVRKPENTEQVFALFHEYKVKQFNAEGCEIKPMINEAFRNRKQHYEIFTYECANLNTSGVDLIYDADKTNIYDLMYEFKTQKLSTLQIQEAINTLKDFKICYADDSSCLANN